MSFNVTYTRFKSFINGGSLLPADLNAIQDDLGNQLADVNVAGGFNEGVNVRRGKFIQSAIGTRSNPAYGALSNGPDEVANVVLPTDGFIAVLYYARWLNPSALGRAAIFVESQQMKVHVGSGGPVVQEESALTDATLYSSLATSPVGLKSNTVAANTPVTTGQAVAVGDSFAGVSGGPVYIFAAAGTYTVSVQYKSSGTVSAQNRKLWVWTQSF